MRVDILTLFPETVGDVLSESILGRAQERGFIRIETHQIRDYTANKQNQVDDRKWENGYNNNLNTVKLRRRDKLTSNSMDVSRKGGKGQEMRRVKLVIHSITQAEARWYAHILLIYKLVGGVERNHKN